MRANAQRCKIWKGFGSFLFLILTFLVVSGTVSASGTAVRTDSGRVDRFTFNATTQTNHEGLRDAPRYSGDSTSMLVADGWGSVSTGYIRTDIHYIDRNNNGALNFGIDDMVYCLHNRKRSPNGNQAFQVLSYSQALNYSPSSWREQTVANDKRTLDGLVAILQNGFPARSAAEMGLSNNGDAYAATQLAVRFWVAERERDLRFYAWNYNFYDQSRSGFGTVSALSGQQAVLTKAHSLLSIARNPPVRAPAISTTLVSASETRTQRDFFIYQYRINLTDLSDGYTITSTNLPSGSSYTGYTGKDGDIIEIKIPFTQANAGRSFSMQFRGTDSAGVGSLEFRPVPTGSNSYQGVIGLNMTVVDDVRHAVGSRTTRTIADPYVYSISTNKSIYAPGETGTATIVLRNQGNRRAEASILEVGGNRYPVRWIDPPEGSSTKSRTITASFTVPSGAGWQWTGNWNLQIRVDADDHVLEVDQPGIGENNNNVSHAIQVGRPDLDITTLSTNKTTYDPGETVTVTTNVRNKGSIHSQASTLTLRRDSTTVAARSIPSLGTGAYWGTQTFTFTAPSPSSTTNYTVRVSIPTGQSPTGVTSRSLTITVRGRPDLDISSLSTNKTIYDPGETVTVTTNVRNIGHSTSGASTLTLRRDSTTVGTRSIPSLGAGASWGTQTFTFTAPSPTSTTNYTVRVSIPTGQSPTGETSRWLTITVRGYPDLTGAIEMVDGKTTFEAGETVRVQPRIMNIGNSPASSFISTFEIKLRHGEGSLVPGYPNDFPIETRTYSTSSLSAGGTVSPPVVTFIAPTSLTVEDIDMELFVDANNTVAESNEANNIINRTIRVNALRPNLYFSEHNITDYYGDQYVIITARVMNGSEQPVPEAQITLDFHGQELIEIIPVQGKGAFAGQPGGYNYEGNLVVFKVKTPNVSAPVDIEVRMDIIPLPDESDITDNALGYYDGSGAFHRFVSTVSPILRYNVPAPDFAPLEEEHLERNRILPQPPVPIVNSTHQWYETRLINDVYVPRQFTAALYNDFSVMPDSRIEIRDYPKKMESGFGLSAEASTMMLTNYDRPQKLIEPQLVWTMYPETEYGQDNSDWYLYNTQLDIMRHPTQADPDTLWQLPVSPYTFFIDDLQDDTVRLHYTPVWTPDGRYEVLCDVFYAWSPLGQMSEQLIDHVDIEEDMYKRFPVFNR